MPKKPKKTKKEIIAEEKFIKETFTSLMNKINSLIEGYGKIKNILHVVNRLRKDPEVSKLITKITDNTDPQMFILLAAAILRVLKEVMEDGDGIFDYNVE